MQMTRGEHLNSLFRERRFHSREIFTVPTTLPFRVVMPTPGSKVIFMPQKRNIENIGKTVPTVEKNEESYVSCVCNKDIRGKA